MTQSATLAEHFAALAAADPDAPAITCAGSTVTRRQLEQRTNRLARAYQQLGVTPDSFVTIGLPNTVEFLEAAIAAWKCGATPQPVSAGCPPGAAGDHRTGRAEPRRRSAAGGGRRPHRDPGGLRARPGLSDAPLGEVAAASLKAPTSGGSTGRPKLIVATQPAVVESVEPFARLMRHVRRRHGPDHGPALPQRAVPASACALLLGGHVVLMPRFDAGAALQLVQEHAVDWMYVVPTMMGRIWRLPEEQRLAYDVSSLRVVLHMAAPCPPWLKRAWIDWLGADRVWELYAGDRGAGGDAPDRVRVACAPRSVGSPRRRGAAGARPRRRAAAAGRGRRDLDATRPGRAQPYRYVGGRGADDGRRLGVLGDMGCIDEEGYLYLADRKTDM